MTATLRPALLDQPLGNCWTYVWAYWPVLLSEQLPFPLDFGVLWADNPPDSPLRRAVSNRSEPQHPLRRAGTHPGLVERLQEAVSNPDRRPNEPKRKTEEFKKALPPSARSRDERTQSGSNTAFNLWMNDSTNTAKRLRWNHDRYTTQMDPCCSWSCSFRFHRVPTFACPTANI